MDSTTIASIILAVVAIIPGVWALYNQANKDKKQAELELNAAAQTATFSIITPLREEVARLQTKVAQLETEITELRQENSSLVQANFDKDTEMRKMQFAMDGMRLRLDKFEGQDKAPPPPKKTRTPPKG